MLIPSPAGFLVLNISSPSVQASCTFHSLRDGVFESQDVSAGEGVVTGGVEGHVIEPSK